MPIYALEPEFSSASVTGGATCTPPTAPTLAVADDADGTGGTATVSGGDAGSTHDVYYVKIATLTAGGSWSLGGTRSGNGTVTLNLAVGYYLFYCIATNADGTAISNLVMRALTNAATDANLESALRDYLGAQPDVTALVGQRIYRVFVPQSGSGQADVGRMPRIVIQRVTGGRSHFINRGDGLPFPSVQLSCHSTNYAESKAIADAVRNCLDAFSGTMGSIYIQAAIADNETDLYEPPDDAKDQGVHQCVLDYRFAYVEAAPTL